MIKKGQPEVNVLFDIVDRIQELYPYIMPYAVSEFCEEMDVKAEEIGRTILNQVFLGWLLLEHRLYDFKSIPQLARQVLDLSEDEKAVLDIIDNAVIGYFEVISHQPHEVKVRDILTDKEYAVQVLSLDTLLKPGIIIRANLAMRLDGEHRFFFGGFENLGEGKEEIRNMNSYKKPVKRRK